MIIKAIGNNYIIPHIDASIKLFDPDYDLRTIKIKQHRKVNLYFKHGESARLVLDVLREVGGVMSTEAVALAMIQKKRLDAMDKDVLVFFKKAAITALRNQEGRGLITNTGRSEDGVMLIWGLV